MSVIILGSKKFTPLMDLDSAQVSDHIRPADQFEADLCLRSRARDDELFPLESCRGKTFAALHCIFACGISH